ncbi:lipoyl(octanoyl) transferase LipB [Pseudoduganella buxea]|uniref:Octanoyltransferase n=1 Tax=Pseudoduganella buxea TaxID=1949069 RepID=A0A6I3SRF3_9BURK|nr:lipoyl(octanoyl) transferase LipB [Pseudoduganella buxea]MTV51286.1 lipoyl(octanoyl) transferase LipB [Pseudoduganella buxea]GGB97217.1 octanoyltransferase [Pseudoduganella buxea]
MSTIRPEPAVIRHLGHADYEPTFAAMRAFTDARTADTPDELWIVEHPPVFTLGLGADRGHLLAGATQVPVVQTDRGGEVTYHGPGQVVIYLLMDLRRNKPGGKLYARQFVTKIEQAIIDVLAAYNLDGERIDGAPGIYIAGGPKRGAKIAALGLKVRGNGCTYHGVSLNVAMDLAPFTWINPCGYAGLETVDMRTMGVDAPLADVQLALAHRLVAQLDASAVTDPGAEAAKAA